MALKRAKQADAEWIFGWNPTAYVDDQITLNQYTLLKEAFEDLLAEQGISGYVAGMSPLRFELQGRRKELGPDLFVVLGCDAREREYWISWEEGGRLPSVIIEFLSRGRERYDRVEKKKLYEEVFGTAEYYLFDPKKGALEGYHIHDGAYVSALPDERGHLTCRAVRGTLGLHQGQLRLWREDRSLVLTRKERAERECERAERECERAERERERADREQLRGEALEAELEHLRHRLDEGANE